MSRIIISLVGLVVVISIAGASWFYRPWSEYSPEEIGRRTTPDQIMASFREMDDIFPYRVIKADESSNLLVRETENAAISLDG